MGADRARAAGSPAALYWQVTRDTLTQPGHKGPPMFLEGHEFSELVHAIATSIAEARGRDEEDARFTLYVGLRASESPLTDGKRPEAPPAVERPGERTPRAGRATIAASRSFKRRRAALGASAQ